MILTSILRLYEYNTWLGFCNYYLTIILQLLQKPEI